MVEWGYELAHPDFYLPLSADDSAEPWRPRHALPGWSSDADGPWCSWVPDDSPVGSHPGWKIHISATLANASQTIDVVADRCGAAGVPFKHLSGSLFYMLMHHKHGPRTQAGKVCTLYPRSADQARSIMEQLADDLEGMAGPYVLTDRRFGESGVVYYRYGAHRGRDRVELDGTHTPMILDHSGDWVPDRREPAFRLPPGIADPFIEEEPPPPTGDFMLNDRYRILGVMQHSNAGGSYRALDTQSGETVMIKEARGHNGLSWNGEDACTRLRREYATLHEVHAADPGLCPAPVDHFTAWENEYVAMEFVPGIRLSSWSAKRGVLQRLEVGEAEAAAYLRDVRDILDQVRDRLSRLHRIGLGFGDLNLNNVLIDDAANVRLIDFEAAASVASSEVRVGTPGFAAPEGRAETLGEQDDYAYSVLCSTMLLPLTMPLERDPAGRLGLYARDLESAAPVPNDLWGDATRFCDPAADAPSTPELPTAADLDQAPHDVFATLADQVAGGLLSMAEAIDSGSVFPPHPDGYVRNTLCLAYGDAGVLQALQQHGVPDEKLHGWWSRLASASLADIDRLPPGMRVGSAGIAVALAATGEHRASGTLLRHARTHPSLWESLDFGFGAAGVGQAHLAAHRHDGSLGYLDHAADIADEIIQRLPGPSAQPVPGLLHGFSGIGLFFHELALMSGVDRYRQVARRLAQVEVDQGAVGPDGVRRFHDTGGRRVISYLGRGSAGVSLLLARLAGDDPQMERAQQQVLSGIRSHHSVQPGLESGLCSWAFAWQQHSKLAGGEDAAAMATRIGTSIAKYLVRVDGGFAPLGAVAAKMHADLSTGSAGVLATLDALVGSPVEVYGLTPLVSRVP